MTKIYSVKTLVGELRNLLESSYRHICLQGEISSLSKPASGHLYFSLKEENAVVRCAFFRNRRSGSTTPVEGMQVLVKGQISLYEQRGDLQLIVSQLEPAGEGALRRAFEQLRTKLEDEGLFRTERKVGIPPYPRHIGIVTSSSGAALQDIRITLNRRYPQARIIVYPTLVQGDKATSQICQMLETIESRDEVDVIILARGGGSLEDLQAFNEESVARAISKCKIPLVSGIGHETDVTIADLVADQRAATPTAAAELVSPAWQEILSQNVHLIQRLARYTERLINQRWQQLDYATSRLVHPTQRVQQYQFIQQAAHKNLVHRIDYVMNHRRFEVEGLNNRLQSLNPNVQLKRQHEHISQNVSRIQRHVAIFLAQKIAALNQYGSSLQQLSPNRTLARGYAILQDPSGKVVTSVGKVKPGQSLTATVADGQFGITANKQV